MFESFNLKVKPYYLLIKIRIGRIENYGFFLGILKLLMVLFFAAFSERNKSLIFIYSWFRVVDNVIDNETKAPEGYTIESYIFQKKKILNGDYSTILPEDNLFLFAISLFKKYKINVSREIKDLFYAMEKEYSYRGKVISQKEWLRNARIQDKAAFMSVIKIVGGDCNYYESKLSSYWGIFTKIDSLEDIEKDLKDGVINISLEDVVKYSIPIEKIVSIGSLADFPELSRWYKEEARKALNQYKEVISIIEGRPEGFYVNMVLKLNLKLQSQPFFNG